MKKNYLIGLSIITILIILIPKDFFMNKSKTIYKETSKTYFAPKSKIRIIVHSKSYVDENSDLGTGTAYVKLYKLGSIIDTLFLETSPENIDFITYKLQKIKFDCGQMEKYKLYNYLISIGFQNINKNEINELRDAMTFINYGTKATLLYGQTKYIVVTK